MTLSQPIQPTGVKPWPGALAFLAQVPLVLAPLHGFIWVGAFSVWTLPAWAQNPSAHMAPKRGMTDITARLQAQAIADSAQRAAQLRPPGTVVHRDALTPNFAPPPSAALAGPAAVNVPTAPAGPVPSMSTLSLGAPAAPAPPIAALWVPAVPASSALLEITNPELTIAQQIHQGLLRCELGASVHIEADARHPGFFNVQGKGFRYRMYPVPTSTGALRLEDKTAGAVWLQLANKSMLMDQTKGRRMADACTHPAQVAYEQATKNNPPPALFDTRGMGRPLD